MSDEAVHDRVTFRLECVAERFVGGAVVPYMILKATTLSSATPAIPWNG